MSETSVDDLTVGFQQMYGVEVEYYLAPDLKDQLLRGMYLRLGNTVRIYLDENLSRPWSRYVAIKELCHLILSDPEYMTADPGTLIELMIFEETTPKDGEAPLDLVADVWAKRAAHEFLFPFEVRAAAKAKIASGEETLFSLAKEYNVPEHVIEWAFNDSYESACTAAWAILDKAA
jgi:Zn-dependent peptidase ImmA (M78 family)